MTDEQQPGSVPAPAPAAATAVEISEVVDPRAQLRETFLEPLGEVPRSKRAKALADRFLLDYTKHTKRAYERDLLQWFAWCAELGIDPLDANRAAVAGFRRALEGGEKPAQPSTVARKLSALAGYYKYAVTENAIASSPLEHVKRPGAPADSPTLGLDRVEAKALLAQAREHSLRAGALVALLLHDGLRISEALNADIDKLGTARGHRTLTIIRKGGARRHVVLAPATAAYIDAYLGDREAGPIFTTKSGGRLDQPGAFRLIRRIAKTAGIEHADRISPHSLRHTFVTLSREAGAPLEDVQDAAGHADPRTTRRYDRGRHNLDRHPAYTLVAFLAD